jgi:hypothetical protein
MHAEQRGILYKNLDRDLQKGYRQGKDKQNKIEIETKH